MENLSYINDQFLQVTDFMMGEADGLEVGVKFSEGVKKWIEIGKWICLVCR